MRTRFLAVTGPAEAVGALGDAVGDRLGPDFSCVVKLPSLRLFTTAGAELLILPNGAGALLGRLFHRRTGGRVTAFDDREAERIAISRGQVLIDDYWGGYVALGTGRGGHWALRDPSAELPLYTSRSGDLRLYFSSVADAFRTGLLGPRLDADFPAQWLAYPYLRTARTGLANVNECLPGTRLSASSGETLTEAAWTPWAWAAPERATGDFDEATRLLREELLKTIPLKSAGYPNLLLELSGGLDSALIAGALRRAQLPFSSVNFVTLAADGDERRYARVAAQAAASPLTELFECGEPLDLSAPAARRARPGLSPVVQPLHEAFARHAAAESAGAFVTGTGGDNVFCYLTTAAPVIDAARGNGFMPAIAALRDVAELCDCTIWTAARYAAARAFRKPRKPPWKRDLSFLNPAAVPSRHDPHPWLDEPIASLPGKREHVEALVRIQHFLDPDNRASDIAFIHPLMAQPIMELCLTIPTWMWASGGRNRAVARAALADLVPQAILQRRTKGRLESMCARYYMESRGELTSILLDGLLRRSGTLDHVAVETYLGQDEPPRDALYFRIFELAALELWLRSWSAG